MQPCSLSRKLLVEFRSVLEAGSVGYHEGGVDLALLDKREELRQVMRPASGRRSPRSPTAATRAPRSSASAGRAARAPGTAPGSWPRGACRIRGRRIPRVRPRRRARLRTCAADGAAARPRLLLPLRSCWSPEPTTPALHACDASPSSPWLWQPLISPPCSGRAWALTGFRISSRAP